MSEHLVFIQDMMVFIQEHKNTPDFHKKCVHHSSHVGYIAISANNIATIFWNKIKITQQRNIRYPGNYKLLYNTS